MVQDGLRHLTQNHLKINSVPVDHINHQAQGPLGWISSGKVDIDLHILFPHTQNSLLSQVKDEMKEITDKASEQIKSIQQNIRNAHSARKGFPIEQDPIPVDAKTSTDKLSYYPVMYPTRTGDMSNPLPEKNVVMYWNVKMNDIKANPPLLTPDLSYLSSAMIRPIVSYLNANRTTVEVPFSVSMALENFNGSSSYYEAGINDVLGTEIGIGVSGAVVHERHLRDVGFWMTGYTIKSLGSFLGALGTGVHEE